MKKFNFQHLVILLALIFGSIVFVQTFMNVLTLTENFSPGTIIQLLAKGPQDSYLTGWPEGHAGAYYWPWYPYFYYGNPSYTY